MKTTRRAPGALLVAALLCVSPAHATSFTTDQSDIYNAVSESGWAVEFIQRGSTIFAVLYVYDQSTDSVWYSATLEFSTSSPGTIVWSGDLYATKGPWFGTVPFNSSQVTLRKVGTMTWTAQSVTGGTLSYSVDGAQVTKTMARVLIRYDDFSGHLAGAIHQTASGCVNSSLNGTAESAAIINISQNGQAVALGVFPANGGSCTYSGALTQAGQMGAVSGTFACSNGETGTFQFFEMQTNTVAVTTRFTAKSNTFAGCQYNGYAAGMRVTTF